MRTYTVVLTKEEDSRVSASVPALPGCHTWGESTEDAIAMAHEAIDLYLEEMRARGEIPPADDTVVVTSVEVA